MNAVSVSNWKMRCDSWRTCVAAIDYNDSGKATQASHFAEQHLRVIQTGRLFTPGQQCDRYETLSWWRLEKDPKATSPFGSSYLRIASKVALRCGRQPRLTD